MTPDLSIEAIWSSILVFCCGEYRYGLTLTGYAPGNSGMEWSQSRVGGNDVGSLKRNSYHWRKCWTATGISSGRDKAHKGCTVGSEGRVIGCNKTPWDAAFLLSKPFSFRGLMKVHGFCESLTPFNWMRLLWCGNLIIFFFQWIHIGLWSSSQFTPKIMSKHFKGSTLALYEKVWPCRNQFNWEMWWSEVMTPLLTIVKCKIWPSTILTREEKNMTINYTHKRRKTMPLTHIFVSLT